MRRQAILVLAILALLCANKLMAGVLTIYPSDDSYVDSNAADDNFGSSNTINVGTGIRRGYLKFNLSSIPDNKTIVSARLRLDTNYSTFTYPEIGAHYLESDDWYEMTITWNNAPTGFNTAATDTLTIVLDENFWTVTGDVDDAYWGDGTYSVVMKLSNEASSTAGGFWSKEFVVPDGRPYLEVEYGAQKYSGGNGSSEHPYRIATPEDMNTIGTEPNDWDANFVMVDDINLADSGTTFNMIGYWEGWNDPDNDPFTGVFDGNGHEISGFTYTGIGANFIGIFSYVSGEEAEIKDLEVVDPNIDTATDFAVGSLVGLAELGTVARCHISGGTIRCDGFAGGLVGGLLYSGTIRDCSSRTYVEGTQYVGGLVAVNCGYIYESFADCNVNGQTEVGGLVGGFGLVPQLESTGVVSCYAMGSVDGNDFVGGLVGNVGDGVICNSYSAARVSGIGSAVGGLVGGYEYHCAVISSYWDTDASEQPDSAGGIGKTTAQMQTAETFVGWGCNSVWTIDDSNDYPRLVWENETGEVLTNSNYGGGSGEPNDPYLIYTAEQLNTMGLVYCDRNKHFKLMADIDLSNFAGEQYNIIGRGLPFEFTGTFDGNSHVISGFCYSSMDESYIGLFGFVRGDASIKNLGLTGPDVEGGDKLDVGALVGWLISGTIDKCYVEGGSVRGGGNVGGLIGEIDSWHEYANISDCYTSCAVEGTGNSVGGIAGFVDNGLISRSFAGGSVVGEEHVGGLVGSNYGSISNSYARGAVLARDRYGGGLVGGNYDGLGEGHISNCYSTGSVTGSDSGGFVANSSLPTSNCFWDKETGGKDTSEGGATGLTTEEMQTESTFTDAGWDFVDESINGANDIWEICDGTNYAKLAWQVPLAGDFNCPDGVDVNDFLVLCEQWLLEELSADVWPDGGDGVVDFSDWASFADGWKSTNDIDELVDFAYQWLKTGANYYIADIAPAWEGDGIVNMPDFAALAENWLEGL